LRDPGAGFGHDTNKVTIFDKSGQEYAFEIKSKTEVASDIIDVIIRS
jgi:phosphopantothenoylcysteine decarboxylase/phosphopantothenate--cysteine ligase